MSVPFYESVHSIWIEWNWRKLSTQESIHGMTKIIIRFIAHRMWVGWKRLIWIARRIDYRLNDVFAVHWFNFHRFTFFGRLMMECHHRIFGNQKKYEEKIDLFTIQQYAQYFSTGNVAQQYNRTGKQSHHPSTPKRYMCVLLLLFLLKPHTVLFLSLSFRTKQNARMNFSFSFRADIVSRVFDCDSNGKSVVFCRSASHANHFIIRNFARFRFDPERFINVRTLSSNPFPIKYSIHTHNALMSLLWRGQRKRKKMRNRE